MFTDSTTFLQCMKLSTSQLRPTCFRGVLPRRGRGISAPRHKAKSSWEANHIAAPPGKLRRLSSGARSRRTGARPLRKEPLGDQSAAAAASGALCGARRSQSAGVFTEDGRGTTAPPRARRSRDAALSRLGCW